MVVHVYDEILGACEILVLCVAIVRARRRQVSTNIVYLSYRKIPYRELSASTKYGLRVALTKLEK